MSEEDLQVLLSESAAKAIHKKWVDTLQARLVEYQIKASTPAKHLPQDMPDVGREHPDESPHLPALPCHTRGKASRSLQFTTHRHTDKRSAAKENIGVNGQQQLEGYRRASTGDKAPVHQRKRRRRPKRTSGVAARQGREEQLFAGEDKVTYDDIRSEAALHAKLRSEAFQKATHAWAKRQGEMAAFYAQQGHMHTKHMQEANQRAAALILKTQGAQQNRVDLHGLYVKEALETIEERIQNGEPGSVLYVITGKGSHSRDGQARIKPAVLRYLQEHHIRCQELNAGMLQVTL